MIKDDCKQSKVLRYFGSTEKQTIQHNEKEHLIFSSYDCTKYINENTNLDVRVADFIANAVVVVSQAGKLRFTCMYSGPFSTSKGSFNPVGIAPDSHGRILTLDGNNKFIHILDKEGWFLHFIDNLLLDQPWCLCVNTRDNIYVTEYRTGKVKKAQYSMWKNKQTKILYMKFIQETVTQTLKERPQIILFYSEPNKRMK